jgi:hypothetical protein
LKVYCVFAGYPGHKDRGVEFVLTNIFSTLEAAQRFIGTKDGCWTRQDAFDALGEVEMTIIEEITVENYEEKK